MHVLACTHFAATMPVDVVKVRMQYAGADGNKLYNGISDCIVKTAKVARARVHLWDLQWPFLFCCILCLRERCACTLTRQCCRHSLLSLTHVLPSTRIIAGAAVCRYHRQKVRWRSGRESHPHSSASVSTVDFGTQQSLHWSIHTVPASPLHLTVQW